MIDSTFPHSPSRRHPTVERGLDFSPIRHVLGEDGLEAFNVYQRIRADLLARGVQVYEYRPDAEIRKQLITAARQERLDYAPVFGLHAKSMVVDPRTVVIGTFNLDARSANPLLAARHCSGRCAL